MSSNADDIIVLDCDLISRAFPLERCFTDDAVALVNLTLITSIQRTVQTVPSSHLHLLYCELGPGSMDHPHVPSTASMTSFLDVSDELKFLAGFPVSSWSYTSPILSKNIWWWQYLPTYPYFILLVGTSGMTVFLLITYCCLFCFCKIYLCSWFLCLLCCSFILKFLVIIMWTFTLKVGSSDL